MTLCYDNYVKFTSAACHEHIAKVIPPPNTPNQVTVNLEPEQKNIMAHLKHSIQNRDNEKYSINLCWS